MAETPDTPDADNSDEPTFLDQQKLQAELARYQAALEAEFELANEKSPEKVIENTLEYFQGNVALACAQIVYLAQNSTSDATRLSASKYVIDRVFKGAVENANDPVKEILKALLDGKSEAQVRAEAE